MIIIHRVYYLFAFLSKTLNYVTPIPRFWVVYNIIGMNNQQVDRIVNFYRINHLFHDPYQLLLDGNFIKIMVERDIALKRKF